MSGPLRTTFVIIVALLVPIVPYVIIGELPGEQWLSSADDDAFAFGATGASLLVADVLLPVPSSIVGTLLAGGDPSSTISAFATDAFAQTARYFLAYPEDIKLYGLSFNTTVGTWAWQGEISHRQDAPLQIDDVELLLDPATRAPLQLRGSVALFGGITFKLQRLAVTE